MSLATAPSRPWSRAGPTARTTARNGWQLHPASWRFAKGHTPRLELLGSDAPYARPSNGQFQVEVKRLRLRLPVRG